MADWVETVRVRWSDVDACGGAHHSHASRWAEQAEHSLLNSIGLSPHAFPRRRIEVDFLRALRFGDRFDVELTIDRLGRTSVVYSWRGVCSGTVHFSGRTVAVHVDSDGRPTELPRGLHALNTLGSKAPRDRR